MLGGIAAAAAVLVTSIALACLARLAPPPEAPEASEAPKARPRVPSPAPEPDFEPETVQDREPVLAGCDA